MKLLRNKKKCWNSIVYSPEGKIAISSMINGKRFNGSYDSVDDIVENQKSITGKSGKWVVAIPDSECISKEITLPAANLEEASKMIEYELHGLVPIDPEGLVYGCYEMSQEAGSYNLCVCVIKKSLIDKYYADLRRINICPDKIIVHSLAIREACPDIADCTVLSANDKVALLIRYAPNRAPMSKYFDVDMRQDYSEEILNHLSCCNPGEKLILALPDAINAQLRQKLASRDSIAELKYTGVDDLDCQTEDGDILSGLISKGAIAVCKNDKYANFNLIHAKELNNRARKKTTLFYCVNTALLAILVLLVWLNLWLSNVRLSREIDIIDKQIEPIKDVAIQVGAKKIQLNAIKEQISSKGKIIEILDDFYGYTPANISLNELKIEHLAKGLRVQIKGQTQDHASAFGYTQALKKAAYIDGLNIGVGHMIPRSQGKSIVEFGAECILSGDSND